MKGFFAFIRQQGVVGLAIGFILGGSISKVVTSLVNDIVQPVIGLIMGNEGLSTLHYGPVYYGRFISGIIDFLIIAAIVYFIFKRIRLDSFDIPKDKQVAQPVK